MIDNQAIGNVLKKHATRHGGKLFDKAMDRVLPPAPEGRSSLKHKLARAALTRIAMRSVPGAIIVGCGLVAKHLLDRQQAGKAETSKATTEETGGTTKEPALRRK